MDPADAPDVALRRPLRRVLTIAGVILTPLALIALLVLGRNVILKPVLERKIARDYNVEARIGRVHLPLGLDGITVVDATLRSTSGNESLTVESFSLQRDAGRISAHVEAPALRLQRDTAQPRGLPPALDKALKPSAPRPDSAAPSRAPDTSVTLARVRLDAAIDQVAAGSDSMGLRVGGVDVTSRSGQLHRFHLADARVEALNSQRRFRDFDLSLRVLDIQHTDNGHALLLEGGRMDLSLDEQRRWNIDEAWDIVESLLGKRLRTRTTKPHTELTREDLEDIEIPLWMLSKTTIRDMRFDFAVRFEDRWSTSVLVLDHLLVARRANGDYGMDLQGRGDTSDSMLAIVVTFDEAGTSGELRLTMRDMPFHLLRWIELPARDDGRTERVAHARVSGGVEATWNLDGVQSETHLVFTEVDARADTRPLRERLAALAGGPPRTPWGTVLSSLVDADTRATPEIRFRYDETGTPTFFALLGWQTALREAMLTASGVTIPRLPESE